MTNAPSPLWKKSTSAPIDASIQRFLAGRDVVLDRELLPYDIHATMAHVRALQRIGCLTGDESESLCAALEALADEFASGRFVLDSRFEDGHSAIEACLTDRLGEIGRKVHLGRSRNDQVQVATRLYMRDRLRRIRSIVTQCANACLDRASKDELTPMPGYTHLQRAVPSTIGLWMASFAESFIDDAILLDRTIDWMNCSPLGTAAGFGVNLPLDRQGVADELEFARVQINPMYAQNSRGKFEMQAMSACWQVMQDIRRLAWDLSLFTTAEFNFVRLPDQFTTGSSIMPNKRNPDVVELLRAMPAVVVGCMAETQQLLSLSSGYHRDLQLTKEPLIRAISVTQEAASITADLIPMIEFNRERMKAAIDHTMYATDRAVELTADGVAFRDAYRQVAGELDQLAERTPDASIHARTSPGGCGRLMLDELRKRLAELDS